MQTNSSLTLSGAIEGEALALRFEDCARFPAADQVVDVAALVPGRRGGAVRLAALLARARPSADARFLDVRSHDPSFAVSLALAEVEGALLLYSQDGAPLSVEKGGPFRLLVPGHPDECVHVKGVAALELARARGRDTRPADDEEHRKLHRKKS
jgi:DMSO/TMAO reductase YedYZ molybdopterin-dependent catalytic subunit